MTLQELYKTCDMRWDDRCMVIGVCDCKYIIREQKKNELFRQKILQHEQERNTTADGRMDR